MTRPQTIWKTKLPKVEHGFLPPSVSRPNPLVIGSSLYVSAFSSGALFCLSRRSGEILWSRELSPFGSDSPLWVAGRVFAKSSHTLFAFDPRTGGELWRFCPYGTEHESLYSHPTVWRQRVFIGDRQGFVHCLSVRTGQRIWSRQTNSANADVNSTPIVIGGVVIVGTNARRVVALDANTGRGVWKRRVDGPAVYGLLRHKRFVIVLGSSVYLISPETGEIEKRLRWSDSAVESVEDFGTKLVAVMKDSAMSGAHELVVCDIARGSQRPVSHELWCPILRYVRDTRIGYLSHLHGVRLINTRGETISDLHIDEDGVGLVDVKNNVIYAVTGQGNVLAIRHP